VVSNAFAIFACASHAHSKTNAVSIVSVFAGCQKQRHQLFDSMSAKVPECPTESSFHAS